ncbi:MAG TPA: glucose-6-phosphate isomerase [Rhabdochlamydiaceae bacterium]|nr:glucose-6-phosphate isomerase [Rhabdochlamydiaceae bacterium]
MSSFSQLKSFKKLSDLSKAAPDFSKEGILTPERIHSMVAEGLGLKLFYGTERVDTSILAALFELATETSAVEKMVSMQSGEVVNFIEGYESENRPALHTAMRDFFDGKEAAIPAKEAAAAAKVEFEKLKKFLTNIGDRFTDLVQIGIGGSDLGPRAIYLALQAFQKKGRKVHFISNVDPDDAAAVLHSLDLSKTVFVIVSKSGTTLETLTNEEYITAKLKKAGLNPKEHLVAVTGQGSPMDDPAKYLASFYIWDYVGGRYSVTSMVGAVMLCFAFGSQLIEDFLRGCSEMDKLAKNSNPKENLPLLSALLGIWNRNFLKHPTVAIIPYSQAMLRFPAHLQQLDMESNGKHIDKMGRPVDFETGPIIWGEVGTNGQHSFYQLIHQGTTVVPLEFIGFVESQLQDDLVYKGTSCQEKLLSNLFAQSIALAIGQKNANPNKDFRGNRPNRILLAKKLDPRTLGAILAFYEHKVAFQGFIWNINSFDQEGVQLGKVLALKMIEQFTQKREEKSIDEKAFPLGAAYLKKLD